MENLLLWAMCNVWVQACVSWVSKMFLSEVHKTQENKPALVQKVASPRQHQEGVTPARVSPPVPQPRWLWGARGAEPGGHKEEDGQERLILFHNVGCVKRNGEKIASLSEFPLRLR